MVDEEGISAWGLEFTPPAAAFLFSLLLSCLCVSLSFFLCLYFVRVRVSRSLPATYVRALLSITAYKHLSATQKTTSSII